MSSLRPRESGSGEQPPPCTPVRKPVLPLWIPILLIVLAVALAGIAYAQFSAKSSLEKRVNDLEAKLNENVTKLAASDTALASDIDVVTKKVGVTDKELTSARAFAEKLRVEHERSLEAQKQLASTVEKKADSTDLAAARAEAATKVAEIQKESETKISSVSSDVKTVASDLATTRSDLASNKRDLQDVKTTLTAEIAKNSKELDRLRLKGERNYFDIDLKKQKKNEMQRVGDIRLSLKDTDTKKGKYGIVIQVDDKMLEKKDNLINEPVQFLVGADLQRYEIVVNKVEKDRVVGYLSTPKDKALGAERPATR